jgi:di/tricarboxylate transporter
MVLARCVDTEEAYKSIDWRILVMIFAMLAISRAMEATGALHIVVDAVMATVGRLPPLAVLAVVYALTSVMTEIISNNAIAVLITPVVIGIADQLGVDARPFIISSISPRPARRGGSSLSCWR